MCLVSQCMYRNDSSNPSQLPAVHGFTGCCTHNKYRHNRFLILTAVFGPDKLRGECPADSRVWAVDTKWGQRQARPSGVSPRRHHAHRDGFPCHAPFVEGGLWFGSLSGQQEDRWHRTPGSLTTTLPAPGPGLHSVSYYSGTAVAMPTGHEAY